MAENQDTLSVQSRVEWRVEPGLTAYADAHAFMEERAAAIRAGDAPERVWLVEHPPLYTAGTSADAADLIEPERFPVFETGRGGQYTYHGPGQRVAYAMLDLKLRNSDVRAYVHDLEEWMIRTLARFDIKGERRDGRVGIWVVRPGGREDKIGAIGVRVRKWVSFHGLALNVNPDLSHFTGIVPCGISEHGVTSLHDLGVNVSMAEVDQQLRSVFEEVFSRETQTV
ncbi:MAG TPA: lipoyl(octanoyl) transferase LipB [Magnetovibrio sp.]